MTNSVSSNHPDPTLPRGWHSRGYLPHFDRPGLVQHITFHLADSLPQDAVTRMLRQLEDLPLEEQTTARRRRLQMLLDRGLGSCALRNTESARVIEESLLFGDGDHYRLLAWVIMPNHVHVLIEQQTGWSLSKVVQSWKRHTARRIRMAVGRSIPDPLWQRDYWDRFIRDEGHYRTAKRYIESNPVEAGLCTLATGWRWGSARLVKSAECSSTIPGNDAAESNRIGEAPGSSGGRAECNSAIPGNGAAGLEGLDG